MRLYISLNSESDLVTYVVVVSYSGSTNSWITVLILVSNINQSSSLALSLSIEKNSLPNSDSSFNLWSFACLAWSAGDRSYKLGFTACTFVWFSPSLFCLNVCNRFLWLLTATSSSSSALSVLELSEFYSNCSLYLLAAFEPLALLFIF